MTTQTNIVGPLQITPPLEPIQDAGSVLAASIASKVKESNTLGNEIAAEVEKGETGSAIVKLAKQNKLNQNINTLKDASSQNNTIIDKGTTKL